jgi:CheY-like chemotaxis protein
VRSQADIDLVDAVNGEAAVRNVLETRPDLSLLDDIRMPVIDGITARKNIECLFSRPTVLGRDDDRPFRHATRSDSTIKSSRSS